MCARPIAVLLMWCSLAGAAVVIDRIAVIVDKHVIKASDIDRDVRVTEFLNRAPLKMSADVIHKAAERLIDQTVIREEMEKGGYSQSNAAEVDGVVKRMLDERFGGSDARLQQELARYRLTGAQLRLQLQWQLDVLGFLNQRFRPGVLVTDDQVKSYYDQHRAELVHQFPQLQTYEALEPKIRASLEGELINKNFEDWLAEARKRDRIVYRQETFQ
jgi:peptidyl-prolyl cis-trans isomerase SurA